MYNDPIVITQPAFAHVALSPQASATDDTVKIHLIRLDDGCVVEKGGKICGQAHVLTIWSGPKKIAHDLYERLGFAIRSTAEGISASGFMYDVAELENMCKANAARDKVANMSTRPTI